MNYQIDHYNFKDTAVDCLKWHLRKLVDVLFLEWVRGGLGRQGKTTPTSVRWSPLAPATVSGQLIPRVRLTLALGVATTCISTEGVCLDIDTGSLLCLVGFRWFGEQVDRNSSMDNCGFLLGSLLLVVLFRSKMSGISSFGILFSFAA